MYVYKLYFVYVLLQHLSSFIFQDTSEMFATLKEFLSKNPSFVGSGNCPQMLMENKNLAYLEDRSYLVILQRQYCSNYSWILLSERLLPSYFAFGVRKHSLYNAIISKEYVLK